MFYNGHVNSSKYCIAFLFLNILLFRQMNEKELFNYFDPSPFFEQTAMTRLKTQLDYISVFDKISSSMEKIKSNLGEIQKEVESLTATCSKYDTDHAFTDLFSSLSELFEKCKNAIVDQCGMHLNAYKSVLLPSLAKMKSEFNKTNQEYQRSVEDVGAINPKTKPEIAQQIENNLKTVMCQRAGLLYDINEALDNSEKTTTKAITVTLYKFIQLFSETVKSFIQKNNENIDYASDYIEKQQPVLTKALKHLGVVTGQNVAYQFASKCWSIREGKTLPDDNIFVSGVMWLKSKKLMKNWVRRYVIFEDGLLTFYDAVNGKKDISLPLALVTVVPINKSKRRNCFKIQSPQNVFLLEALTMFDLEEWITIFTEHNTKMIRGDENGKEPQIKHVCADCGSNDATWYSLNWGTFLCLKCSSVHRQMSTKVSKIRSIILDKLNPTINDILTVLTNDAANSILMTRPCDFEVTPRIDKELRENFIQQKYQLKTWATQKPIPDPFECILKLDYYGLFHAMNFGKADADFNSLKPIHAACAIGNKIICGIAVCCSDDINILDSNGWSPICYAIFYENIEIVKFLLDLGVHLEDSKIDVFTLAIATGNQELINIFLDSYSDDLGEFIPAEKFVPLTTKFAPIGKQNLKELVVNNEVITLSRLLRSKKLNS